MDTAIFIGLSQQSALRRKMDVVAHNIANMDTTAFKKETMTFREYLVDVKSADGTKDGKISYILDHGVIRNLDQGSYKETGNELDIYLDGQGYLSAQGNDGEQLYTRNGHLSRDLENYLVTSTGERILDDGGDFIQFDEEDQDILISDTGLISTENGEVATLGLFQFESEQLMNRRGTSFYETQQTPLEEVEAGTLTVRQYALEGSNVQSVKSMVEMIDVLRSYQSVTRNMERFQDMRKDSLDRLARVQ